MSTLRTTDNVELNLHDWTLRSSATETIVVAILHGYGEHAGRYAHVAEKLNARGIGVLAVDLRGHGRSSGVRGHILSFEEYHRDATALLEAAHARAKGKPVALFGHSMGGLVTYDFMLAGGAKNIAGVVVTSPFLGLALAVNPVKETLGRAMSRLVPGLALPSGLYGKDVTRDPELAAIYDSDPLNNKKATARWFTEATRAIERVHARAAELEGPMLLLYGGADKVASADATESFAKKLRGRDITTERLEGHYHELVNEPPAVRAPIIDRIGTWLLGRVPQTTIAAST